MMVVTNDGDDWTEYNEPNFQQACSFPGPAGKEISMARVYPIIQAMILGGTIFFGGTT